MYIHTNIDFNTSFYAFDSSLLRDLGEPWDYYFSSSYIQATYFDYFDYFDVLISSRLIFYLSSTGQVLSKFPSKFNRQ